MHRNINEVVIEGLESKAKTKGKNPIKCDRYVENTVFVMAGNLGDRCARCVRRAKVQRAPMRARCSLRSARARAARAARAAPASERHVLLHS